MVTRLSFQRHVYNTLSFQRHVYNTLSFQRHVYNTLSFQRHVYNIIFSKNIMLWKRSYLKDYLSKRSCTWIYQIWPPLNRGRGRLHWAPRIEVRNRRTIPKSEVHCRWRNTARLLRVSVSRFSPDRFWGLQHPSGWSRSLARPRVGLGSWDAGNGDFWRRCGEAGFGKGGLWEGLGGDFEGELQFWRAFFWGVKWNNDYIHIGYIVYIFF